MIYCGLDGGGTKTKIIIADDYKILIEWMTGPTSIDTVSLDESMQCIDQALKEIYIKHQSLPLIDAMFLGLGGITGDHHIKIINKRVRDLPFFAANAVIDSANDIVNAYISSCSGRPNITLIIGTGAVAYGVDESGKSHRANGIHCFEGDFGSGYDMGIRALKRMSQAFDKRVSKSPLTNYLLTKFNISTIESLSEFFIKYRNNRTFIASLAKTVTDFAAKNDQTAIGIIEEATDEMMLSLKAVDQQIKLKNREVSIIGGLGNSPIYFQMMKHKIEQYDARFYVHKSERDPAEGSLIIAKKMILSHA